MNIMNKEDELNQLIDLYQNECDDGITIFYTIDSISIDGILFMLYSLVTHSAKHGKQLLQSSLKHTLDGLIAWLIEETS